VATIGVFALLSAARSDRPVATDADLTGLSQSHPAIASLLAICLFSLIGLPPTAGVLGTLNLFYASWSADSPWGQPLAIAIAPTIAGAAAAVATLAIFVMPQRLWDLAVLIVQ
jgi:NADH-quinone oxidoreductase subunit N